MFQTTNQIYPCTSLCALGSGCARGDCSGLCGLCASWACQELIPSGQYPSFNPAVQHMEHPQLCVYTLIQHIVLFAFLVSLLYCLRPRPPYSLEKTSRYPFEHPKAKETWSIECSTAIYLEDLLYWPARSNDRGGWQPLSSWGRRIAIFNRSWCAPK